MLAGVSMRALTIVAKTLLPTTLVGSLSGLGGDAINKVLESGLFINNGGKVYCKLCEVMYPKGTHFQTIAAILKR